jgi:plastocyanin
VALVSTTSLRADRPIGRRAVVRAGTLGVLGAVLAACRDDRPGPIVPVLADPPADPPVAEWSGPRVDVEAIDNAFHPRVVEVAAGTMVVWRNTGENEHDVVPVNDDSWGAQRHSFPPGSEYGHVFHEAGEFDYYCTVHGTTTIGMVGTVVVTA